MSTTYHWQVIIGGKASLNAKRRQVVQSGQLVATVPLHLPVLVRMILDHPSVHRWNAPRIPAELQDELTLNLTLAKPGLDTPPVEAAP